MNVQLALLALEKAGIEGRGAESARQLLAKDPWPTGLALPRLDGQYVDPAAPIGALAKDFTEARVTAADLPRRVADIAAMRVGCRCGTRCTPTSGRCTSTGRVPCSPATGAGSQKEIDRREAAARKQLKAAHTELTEAAKRLDENEVTSRARAVRAGGKAAEAWDNRVQADSQLRALHGLRQPARGPRRTGRTTAAGVVGRAPGHVRRRLNVHQR